MPKADLRMARIGWLRALYRYYRDPSASVVGKLVMVFALAYAVMPLDLIPDVPLVGWLDDIGVMGIAVGWLTRTVSRYREALPEPIEPARRPFSVSP